MNNIYYTHIFHRRNAGRKGLVKYVGHIWAYKSQPTLLCATPTSNFLNRSNFNIYLFSCLLRWVEPLEAHIYYLKFRSNLFTKLRCCWMCMVNNKESVGKFKSIHGFYFFILRYCRSWFWMFKGRWKKSMTLSRVRYIFESFRA